MNITVDNWTIEQKLILQTPAARVTAMPRESSRADWFPDMDVETVWFAKYTGPGWPDEAAVLDAVEAVRRRDPHNRILITGFPKLGDRIFAAEVV